MILISLLLIGLTAIAIERELPSAEQAELIPVRATDG